MRPNEYPTRKEADAAMAETANEELNKFCPTINGKCREDCRSFYVGFIRETTVFGKPGSTFSTTKPTCINGVVTGCIELEQG